MASSAERWVIVADGKQAADIRDNVPVFTFQEEAERSLVPGERVEQLSVRAGEI